MFSRCLINVWDLHNVAGHEEGSWGRKKKAEKEVKNRESEKLKNRKSENCRLKI